MSLDAYSGLIHARPYPVLRVKRFHPDAILPKYQTAGAACFDLHCIGGGTVPAMESHTFMTGLAYEVPPGFVMMIYSRSGHGFNNGVRLANNTGVIDSDYRGEIMVKLRNDSRLSLHLKPGDRVAQAMLIPVQQWLLEEVSELSSTDRGASGFGSTGA